MYLGQLKLPQFSKPIYGLLVGTKNGLLQLIYIKDNKPEIIWQRNVYASINAVEIGDVTNNGYNEIVVATEDGYIKIFDSEGKRVTYIGIREARPMSLKIEDIDGDSANEIIVGCTNGTLKVYQNINLESELFELKWKATGKSSIKYITIFTPKDKKNKHIIFGGYDRTLRNISDFKWGQKPRLEIPKRAELSEIPLVQATFKVVPTNIREYITKFLKEKGFILTLELLIKELMNFGYSREEIEDELERMKLEGALQYEKINIPVWGLAVEESVTTVPKIKVEPTKPPVIVEVKVEKPEKKEISVQTEKSPEVLLPNELQEPSIVEKATISEEPILPEELSEELSVENAILEYLKEKGVVSSKAVLVKGIIEKGFSESEATKGVDTLNDENKISYSRSKPRGWSIVE